MPGRMAAFTAGFALGFSLILAIGAQNAFVLRQGLRGEHVFAVCLTCAVSDAILIATGVGGIGALTGRAPWMVGILRWGGVIFLVCYGALSARSAWRGGARLEAAGDVSRGLALTVATCLALTWLNPHVYLDTVVLLGSVAVQWPGRRPAFGAGAVAASFFFFFALGYGARSLRPVFAAPSAWRSLDLSVAMVMWALAAGLAFG